MKPTRDTRTTLVDLLERLLDKGVVLQADLIVDVAGIPLLGISLRACIASMETMLKYGIWNDWDEANRAIAAKEAKNRRELPLDTEEKILMSTFASQWYDSGLYGSWRPGHLYVTDRRMLLYRKSPPEVLFQCSFEDIENIEVKQERNTAGKVMYCLGIKLFSDDYIKLHTIDVENVKEAIDMAIKAVHL